MTRRKRTDSLDALPSHPPTGVRQRKAEPVDHGGQQVTEPDVEMGAPTTEEPPAGPSTSSSGASQLELADPSAPNSELVKDTLSNTESEELDRFISNIFPWTKDHDEKDRAYMHAIIVKRLVQKYSELDQNYMDEVAKVLDNNTWLPPLLDKCWEKGEFRVIRRLKILWPATLPTSVSQELEELGRATLVSWQRKYMGNAADVLLQTISSYLAQGNNYGPHASILNSSGTGKSRMVDELSRTIITVPMCLRSGSAGFPPPDVNLRVWFNRLGSRSREDVVDQLYCMISSLLNVTLKKLQDIEEEKDDIKTLKDLIAQKGNPPQSTVLERQRLLAKTFRERMTKGQKFSEVNAYRQLFFGEVIALVEEAVTNRPLSSEIRGNDIRNARQALQTFLDHRKVLPQTANARKPFVIFSFDEAHELNEPKYENWTIYIELCRCLYHHLVATPFFFLFISTAGNFHGVSPETRTQWDPSTRISDGSPLAFPPITETGFDQLALTAIEGQTTLEEVTSDRWITHLGRPLFGSRYDASGEVFAPILQFATWKLLAGRDPIDSYGSDLSSGPLDKALACFSVRFPLEFDFSHRDTRAILGKQIERHMRLCTVAESGFELLFSTVGSEPLLAEAASYFMDTPETNPVELLRSYMDNKCISVGERGELVAALLIMHARDVLATSACERSVGVIEFMQELVNCPDLRTVLPQIARGNEVGLQFQDAFQHSRIWVNHVLKVRDSDLINTKHLWTFVTRGAMILCPNGQRGVDLVIPVVHSQGVLSRHNMTAILIQVQNDPKFTTAPSYLFNAMDPLAIGVFDSTQQSHPIIRMVFALASNTCGVTCLTPGPHSPASEFAPNAQYTAYDFWCKGLDTETFPLIDNQNREAYEHLLARTRKGNQLYNVKSSKVKYSNEVMNAKTALLRQFDPLSEKDPLEPPQPQTA